mmetsp:Transcript_2902/g.5431  ORF Transcript_2902/g.5431 Transcript_2902/m.5431 type:complete len:92 (+) Transcript_2902:34-309(+)
MVCYDFLSLRMIPMAERWGSIFFVLRLSFADRIAKLDRHYWANLSLGASLQHLGISSFFYILLSTGGPFPTAANTITDTSRTSSLMFLRTK